MISDNETTPQPARAAGVGLVLMRYGYSRVDPESLNADALLDHFSELPQALERLGLTPWIAGRRRARAVRRTLR